MESLSKRRAMLGAGAAAMVTGGLLASGLAAAPASAAPGVAVTAHPSDDTVRSGEQFRVRGLFSVNGAAALDRTVKIQALYSDGWRNVTGARVSTGDDGRYGVRLVLSMKGERVLRAVGITPSPDRPDAKKRFTVTVS